ncbi:MAG TPA: hypothetical protein EYP23_04710 [Thermoplasmata archaeon]|nr:hypothetical protein [Thermoplasmata archaeon]
MFEILDYLMWFTAVTLLSIAVGFMSWKVAPYFKFAYPTAKVQAIGNPFVREKELQQLLESKSLDSFKNNLNSFKDYSVEGVTAAEIQRSLDQHFLRAVRMIQKDGPKKLRKFYDAYLEIVDGGMIKHVLKAKIMEEEIKEELPVILPESKEVIGIIKSTPLEELVSVLKERGFDEEVVEALKDGGKDVVALDVAMDKWFLGKLKSVKTPREVTKIKNEFVARLMDIRNIRNLLRAKQLGYRREDCEKLFIAEGQEVPRWMFKEMVTADGSGSLIDVLQGTFYFPFLKKELDRGGGEKSMQPFENALDKALLEVAGSLSIKNFPLFGPLLRFIIAKEFEIRNLKVIAKGIEENVGVGRIKPLLIMEE